MMASRRDDLHFHVHPSVVFQLGADLISDLDFPNVAFYNNTAVGTVHNATEVYCDNYTDGSLTVMNNLFVEYATGLYTNGNDTWCLAYPTGNKDSYIASAATAKLVDMANKDLHLQSSSPARGGATTLSTEVPTDYEGKPRVAPYDFGAYRF